MNKLGTAFVALTLAVSGADARNFHFTNNCPQTIWVGTLGNTILNNGGWALDSYQSNDVGVPDGFSGRFWGRTGCNFDGDGNGHCETGDCGNRLECNGAGGIPPASLAEMTLNGDGGQDFYDVSLVDGYNVPLRINVDNCESSGCVSDLNDICPQDLQEVVDGRVVACLSACEKYNTDEYCCRGDYGTPDRCPPTSYSEIFKTACPQAYSYAYDDKTSTFTCPQGSNYEIVFCP